MVANSEVFHHMYVRQVKSGIIHFWFCTLEISPSLAYCFSFWVSLSGDIFLCVQEQIFPMGLCVILYISNTADSHSASSSSLTLFNLIVCCLPYCSKLSRPIVRSLTLFPSSATEDWRILICSLHKLISVLRTLISSFSDLFEDL